MTKMRIAAYCRVSTGNEEQLDSLHNQREFFVKYAKDNGYELVCVYADEGITGTSLKKRAEFKRMMCDAKQKKFDAVVVKDISRFARNTVDFLQGIRELKLYGINTVFVNANMESFGESEFILTVFSAFAQEESVNISKRVKFGKKISAQKGSVPHSVFGYDRIDNYTLAINPAESAAVKKIYGLYVDEGLGCRRISAHLNKDGDKTKNGGEWSPKGVLRVLKNSIYCGEYVNSKYEVIDCISKKIVYLPPEKHIVHKRPDWAIITKEYFMEAQKRLGCRSKKIAPETGKKITRYSERYAFSCLIKCEECGRSFTRKKYTCKTERIYWKCPTNDQFTSAKCSNNITLTEADLIQKIKDLIDIEIGDRELFIDGIIEAFHFKFGINSEIEKIDKKINEHERERSKYMELFVSDIIDLDKLKQVMERLDHSLCLLKQKKENIMAENGFIDRKSSEIKESVRSFLSLENVTGAELRKIIRYISVNSEGCVKIYLV